MEKTPTQKLAALLKILVTVIFVCNILVLFLVPGLAGIQSEGGWHAAWGVAPGESVPTHPILFLVVCWQYLFRVWREPYAGVLSSFLLICGGCTAAVLWQARRVLDTVLAGNPFQLANAQSLHRAAVCCFVIAGAALLRTVWRLWYYTSLAPLLTYNALFVPVFTVAGLLCLVMSALFRQAAQLKEENDLTI